MAITSWLIYLVHNLILTQITSIHSLIDIVMARVQ